MQKIKCDSCGSNQLIKKDGYYICEYCKTKYAIETTKKDKQIEKRNQEMARRKAEAEAREQALKAKKKKNAIIIAVAVVLVVAIACGVGIPVGLRQSTKYTKVNFKSLPVPTTVAEAQNSNLVQYNGKNVVMEGYTFACTSKYYVLCKSAVQSCPYVTGTVPNNGVRMEMKDGSHFNMGNNAKVRIYGKLKINTVAVEKFEGQETYMYLILDKIEEI